MDNSSSSVSYIDECIIKQTTNKIKRHIGIPIYLPNDTSKVELVLGWSKTSCSMRFETYFLSVRIEIFSWNCSKCELF